MPVSPFSSRSPSPSIDPAEYDERQRALHARLVESRGREQVEDSQGRLRAAYALMVLEPTLGSRLEALGSRLRLESAVPADLREVAILAVAAGAGSRTQWQIHLSLARALGVTLDELEDEPAPHPPFATDTRRAVWRAVTAWLANDSEDRVDRERLVDSLGAAGLYELVTTVGYYRLLATQLAVFGIDTDADGGAGGFGTSVCEQLHTSA